MQRRMNPEMERKDLAKKVAQLIEEAFFKEENGVLTEDELVRKYFFAVYGATKFNKRKTARLLGISYQTLYNRLEEYSC